MGEKRKLSIANFLKILPIRNKKIDAAASDEPKPLASYKPNRLAMVLHPGRQALKVAAVTDVSDDVRLYTLVPDREAGTESLAPFGAGSYVSVEIETDGCVFRRPYSITSSPGDAVRGRYEIAVRAVPDGKVSKYIHENWAPGTRVTASEPAGEFQYEPLRDAPTVICVAGGTGITPFRSMIRAILEGSEDFRLTLIYGARYESDLLFRDELEEAARLDPRIRIVYVLSDEEIPGREHGYVTAEIIRRYAPIAGPYSVFVCGPQAMYRHLGNEIPKLGLRRKYVRYEMFGQISDPGLEPDYVKPEKEIFTVTVIQNGAEKKIPCRFDESLLSAMERAGIRAPSLCRSGECGFCHSKLVSGNCYIPERQDRRREADRIYGYIHPCCAFPLSDVTLDVPGCPS
ncbi:MAG: 2Fe-2S iron-sulfur cluster binding domain-containing protein [Clostridia bacterium]|nr:2Fe-2S iron-sulfur cluster binding domain-containing protein [Clostridia bacterium]